MKKTLVFIIALTVVLTGCSKDTINEPIVVGFVERVAFKEWEDDWVLKMAIYQNDRNKDEITHVTLTGYNGKFKTIDEYNLKILDEDKKIVDTVVRSMPYLGDNPTYDVELKNIHDYLTEKKYQDKIIADDLNGLDLSVFSKDLIVEMYNDALSKEKLEVMKYGNLPVANCKQITLSNNDRLQVSYVLGYGAIGYINIEYIYSDGTYLGDLIEENRADKEQIESYTSLKGVSEKIKKENEWNVEFEVSFGEQSEDVRDKLTSLLEGTFTKEQQ